MPSPSPSTSSVSNQKKERAGDALPQPPLPPIKSPLVGKGSSVTQPAPLSNSCTKLPFQQHCNVIIKTYIFISLNFQWGLLNRILIDLMKTVVRQMMIMVMKKMMMMMMMLTSYLKTVVCRSSDVAWKSRETQSTDNKANIRVGQLMMIMTILTRNWVDLWWEGKFSWVIVLNHTRLLAFLCAWNYIWAQIKMTGETPEVRSDKRKPREDRQNHRYQRYHG